MGWRLPEHRSAFPAFAVAVLAAALGLGAVASVGYSVVTDLVPPHRRGLVMGLWGLSQGVGSLAGVATFVAVMLVIDTPLLVIVGGVTTAIVIVVRHRGNIARLWAGTERRVGMGEGTH